MSTTSVGQIGLDLKINSSNIRSQLKNAVNIPLKDTNKIVSGSLTGSFKKFGKAVVAAFAVKKVVQFSKACIDLGSDLAEVQNVVDVTFGKGAKTINSWAKTTAKAYGVSELSAKKYSGTMGAMLKSMGLTSDKALDMSMNLTGLAGDLASFYNLDTDEAFTKIRSGISGEIEPLKQLGINMSIANLEAYALSKGITKSFNAMTQSEKALLRYNYLLSVTSDAQGDFSRTSGGWANQTRILKLNFDSLKATIGQLLINCLLPLVKMLNGVVEATNRAATALSSFIGISNQASGGAGVVGSIAASTGDMSDNLNNAAGSAKALKKTLSGVDKLNVVGSSDSGGSGGVSVSDSASSITPTVSDVKVDSKATTAIKKWFNSLPKLNLDVDWSTVGANLKKGLSNVWKSVKNWTTCTLTIGINILNDIGLGNLITKLSELWQSFTNLTAVVSGVLSPALVSFYNVALSPLVKLLGETLSGAITVLCGLFDGLAGFISENEEICVAALGAITAGVVAFKAASAFKSVVKGFQEARLAIKLCSMEVGEANLAQAALNGTLKVGETIVALLTGKMKLSALAQGLMTKAQAALNAVMSANPIGLVVAAIAALVAGFVILWNKCEGFRNFWIGLWEGIKTAVGVVVEWVKENWQTMLLFLVNPLAGIFQYCYDHFEGFRNFVDGIISKVSGYFSGLWQSIKDGAKSAWDFLNNNILSPIKETVKTFINGIIKGLNVLIKGLNLLQFDVPDWVPVMGGKKWGFNIPKIPMLAQGGYVEANTPQLAIIGDNKHEGEIVAPESKITEAVMAAIGPLVAEMRALIAAVSRGGSGSGGQTIKLYVDGKQLFEWFVKYNNSVVRQTGKSPLKT